MTSLWWAQDLNTINRPLESEAQILYLKSSIWGSDYKILLDMFFICFRYAFHVSQTMLYHHWVAGSSNSVLNFQMFWLRFLNRNIKLYQSSYSDQILFYKITCCVKKYRPLCLCDHLQFDESIYIHEAYSSNFLLNLMNHTKFLKDVMH